MSGRAFLFQLNSSPLWCACDLGTDVRTYSDGMNQALDELRRRRDLQGYHPENDYRPRLAEVLPRFASSGISFGIEVDDDARSIPVEQTNDGWVAMYDDQQFAGKSLAGALYKACLHAWGE